MLFRSVGYHSVFYVKKDSPYKTVQDLKGKNFGLVDPNSTSGNNVPRFALDKMGIDPETFFGKLVYTGSHENAVIALAPSRMQPLPVVAHEASALDQSRVFAALQPEAPRRIAHVSRRNLVVLGRAIGRVQPLPQLVEVSRR